MEHLVLSNKAAMAVQTIAAIDSIKVITLSDSSRLTISSTSLLF
jgi:hypothetical protein